MTLLDEVLSAVDDRENLVGLWLATHPEIPSIGPGLGMRLLEIAAKAEAALPSMQEQVAKRDIQMFIAALRFVSHVELVHGVAIATKLEKWLEAPNAP